MGRKIKGGINTTRGQWDYVYSAETKAAFAEILDLDESKIPDEKDPAVVAGSVEGARVILSTWGAVPYTAELLARCPDLQLILYAAGAFKAYVTPALLEQNPTVCTAVHLNAIPTAEFTLGIILSSLKNVYDYQVAFKESGRNGWKRDGTTFNGGYYKTRVGLIGFGQISQHLLKLLQPFEMECYVQSEYVSDQELAQYGAQKQSLEWIMANCDVVSLHKSDVPKNWDLINADNLKLMKKGARLINTARGRIVNESALIARLREGEITAYLDVTHPEPPEEGHPFYSLPNCILTPHVAGSVGGEVHRMSDYCLRELRHWIAGEPLERTLELDGLDDRA